MIEIKPEDRKKLSKLFEDYKWNYLADAILEGHTGNALVDNEENPNLYLLELPSVRLFIAGGDAKDRAVQEYMQQLTGTALFIFASPGWEELAEEYHKGRILRLPRYAFTSEALNKAHLQDLKTKLAEGYRLEKMEIKLAEQIVSKENEITGGHLKNFDFPQDFIDHGFGFCILKDDEIVCIASTFVVCEKGIEIQINTRKDHRGKGLATAAAAALMLHSLENGLDPNWDAATPTSASLAKKLGYTQQGDYNMVMVVKSKFWTFVGKIIFKMQGMAVS